MAAVIINKDDTLEGTVAKINAEIARRVTYGMRREVLPAKRSVVKLVWSNGSASWYTLSRPQFETVCPGASKRVKNLLSTVSSIRDECKGEVSHAAFERAWRVFQDAAVEENTVCKSRIATVQCVDANEVVVVGLAMSKLDVLAPVLDSLPLYSGSSEAKKRGSFSLKGIEVPPAIARQRLDDLDAQTLTALVEKAMEEAY